MTNTHVTLRVLCKSLAGSVQVEYKLCVIIACVQFDFFAAVQHYYLVQSFIQSLGRNPVMFSPP